MGPVILYTLPAHDSDFKVMPRNFMSCTGIFGVLVSVTHSCVMYTMHLRIYKFFTSILSSTQAVVKNFLQYECKCPSRTFQVAEVRYY